MTILSNLSIDLTTFNGRILIVSDLYGHFELLRTGLSRLTAVSDELVIITTGNLFDWGPSAKSLLKSIVQRKIGDQKVHVFSVVGFHELLMTDAITQKNNKSLRYYPDTHTRKHWRSLGGKWHDQYDQILLERDIYKIDYPLVINVKTKHGIYIIGSSDIPQDGREWKDIIDTLNKMDSQKLRIMATNITRSRYFLDSGKVIDNVSLVVLGAHQPKEIAYGQRSNAVINKQITCLFPNDWNGLSSAPLDFKIRILDITDTELGRLYEV
jgi:hypothetical protein